MLRKIMLYSILVCIITVGSCISSLAQSVMINTPAVFNQPVHTTKIQLANGIAVTNNQPFSFRDDWMKGLTIEITNMLDKPVYQVEVAIDILKPTTKDNESIGYLRHSLIWGDDKNFAQAIAPRTSVQLVFDDLSYSQYRKLIEKHTRMSAVKEVRIIVRQVQIDRTTRWSQGRILHPDPANPDIWIPERDVSKSTNQGIKEQISLLFVSTSSACQNCRDILYEYRYRCCVCGNLTNLEGNASTVDPYFLGNFRPVTVYKPCPGITIPCNPNMQCIYKDVDPCYFDVNFNPDLFKPNPKEPQVASKIE